MSTRNLVDPELLPILDQLPPLNVGDVSLLREETAVRIAAMPASVTTGYTKEEVTIPSEDGNHEIRILIYRKEDVTDTLPVVFHIHGGGMIVGSPEMMEARNAALAYDFKCMVVSVDYRLAPEVNAPDNIEDCYAAYKWLHNEANRNHVDTDRIAVLGESAGGGLAASLVLLLRDRAEFKVAAQFLLSPMLDDRTDESTANSGPYGEFIWTAELNRFGWKCLLGHEPGGKDVSPYASPARVLSVEGLPPTYISVGALDLFFHEDIKYAHRLANASIPIELHVYPGAYHGFDMIDNAEICQFAQANFESAISRFIKNSSD